MDINEYMKKSLEFQERTVAALEALIKTSKTPDPVEAQPVEAQPVEAQPVEAEPVEAEPVKVKTKKVTADDARKALKAYAAVEGNAAAMELLTSFGARSVSALAEQDDGKLAELVAKCEAN